MDMGSKIAAAILGAALLLVVAFVGYREFERRRDIADARAVMQSIAAEATQASNQAQVDQLAMQERRDAAHSRQLMASMQADQARTLSPAQRCIGGTVVTVNGSTYTQARGADGRPVGCSGRMAVQRLR